MSEEKEIRKSYLVTAEEMRAYDTYTIEKTGLDVLVLMERASLALLDAGLSELSYKNTENKDAKVLCVCGTGNNGGDGLACARLFADKEISTDVLLLGNQESMTPAAKKQLSILKEYGIPVYEGEVSHPSFSEYDLIVDALFGTGLKREITGSYSTVIEAINQSRATVVSADIPSGICADNGNILGTAVKADRTVTFAYGKRGLYLYPGCEYAGRITVADIGITNRSFAGKIPGMYTLTGNAKSIFSKRKPDGNKGTFGKMLIAAGSKNMAGAAVLCALSAYKTGAGMVKLVIPECIKKSVLSVLPEALIQTYENEEGLSEAEKNEFLKNMEWADVFVCGPGLGCKKSAGKLFQLLLTDSEKPLLLDADALNMTASDNSLKNKITEMKDRQIIMTPHMGEVSRLLHKPVKEITEAEADAVKQLSVQFQCTIAGKSARSYVYHPGRPMYLNTAGNDRMATAGSGDVLTGMIGALLAQGMPAYDAAVYGVFLHAKAGDAAQKKAGGAGIRAMDIIEGMSIEEDTVNSNGKEER